MVLVSTSKAIMIGYTWMNRYCDFTVGILLVMSGSGESIGDLGLVERTPFIAWFRWPWSDSTETGLYFEALD